MRWLGILLTALATGCGADNALGVAGPFTLSVSVAPASSTGTKTLVNGQAYYQCTFTFTARSAGGRSQEFAGWGGGEIHYRLSSNGTTSNDFLGPTDFQDWFGSDRIKVEQTLTATRSFAWTGPFTATVLVRYAIFTVDNPFGEEHTVSLPIACQ